MADNVDLEAGETAVTPDILKEIGIHQFGGQNKQTVEGKGPDIAHYVKIALKVMESEVYMLIL